MAGTHKVPRVIYTHHTGRPNNADSLKEALACFKHIKGQTKAMHQEHNIITPSITTKQLKFCLSRYNQTRTRYTES